VKRIKHLQGRKEVKGHELNRGDQFLEKDSVKYFFSMECAPYVKSKSNDVDFEAFCMDYYERIHLDIEGWYVRLNKHQKKQVVNGRKYIFEEKEYEYEFSFEEDCFVEFHYFEE